MEGCSLSVSLIACFGECSETDKLTGSGSSFESTMGSVVSGRMSPRLSGILILLGPAFLSVGNGTRTGLKYPLFLNKERG